MSTNLALIRVRAGVAALAGHLPTREGLADGAAHALRFLVSAADEAVPAHVLTAARYERFSSRGEAGFAGRVRSAMRRRPAATPGCRGCRDAGRCAGAVRGHW